MQDLHLVGYTTDRRHLIFSARRGAKSGGFLVPVDDELLAAIDDLAAARDEDGDDLREEPEAPPAAPRVESRLSVREVQARLRAGADVGRVADDAGVDADWVERFAAPVRAEQRQMIDRALQMRMERPRAGLSSVPLRRAVAAAMAERGVAFTAESFDAAWSARLVGADRWVVEFRYEHRGSTRTASWAVDADAGALTATDRTASQLGFVGEGEQVPPESQTIRSSLTTSTPVPPAAEHRPGGGAPAGHATAGKPARPEKRRASKRRAASKPASPGTSAKKAGSKKAGSKKAGSKKAASRKRAAPAKKAAAKRKAAPAKKASKKQAAPKKAAAKRKAAPAKKASSKQAASKKAAPGRKPSKKRAAPNRAAPKRAAQQTARRPTSSASRPVEPRSRAGERPGPGPEPEARSEISPRAGLPTEPAPADPDRSAGRPIEGSRRPQTGSAPAVPSDRPVVRLRAHETAGRDDGDRRGGAGPRPGAGSAEARRARVAERTTATVQFRTGRATPAREVTSASGAADPRAAAADRAESNGRAGDGAGRPRRTRQLRAR